MKTSKEQYPEAQVNLWFFDGHLAMAKKLRCPCSHEYIVGLKPIVRKIWSPIGKRATAIEGIQVRYIVVRKNLFNLRRT